MLRFSFFIGNVTNVFLFLFYRLPDEYYDPDFGIMSPDEYTTNYVAGRIYNPDFGIMLSDEFMNRNMVAG
ncbi:unnamed protein product [Rhizophagus irregularis]|nr:unnamed protein product [Rhizophagus irregularis]